MLTEVFNTQLTANGGFDNLLGFRMIGGELVYLSASHDKAVDADSHTRFKAIVTGDVVKVYKKIQSPQGPQIPVVTILAIEMIASLIVRYDETIHTDFTKAEAFPS